MDLEEFDELLEELVDSFGKMHPKENSFSEEEIIEMIGDVNPDNFGYYINLLKEMDIVFETEYPSEVDALPDGKRYMLGSSAMEWYLRRKQNRRQKYLTIAIVAVGIIQIIFVMLQFLF